jgi:uncharacterized membrane protein
MNQDAIRLFLTNAIFIGMGIVCVYVGIKDYLQKDHPSKLGTAIYWVVLGIILAFGTWIQRYGNQIYSYSGDTPNSTWRLGDVIIGALVILVTLPAIFNKVRAGNNPVATKEYCAKMSDKIGFKIFIPAFTIGAFSLIFAFFLPQIGAIPGMGIGIIVAAIIIILMSRDKPVELLDGGKRLAEVVGPLSLLPQLLASLGAVFTAAGVGQAVASVMRNIVPEGNLMIGIVVYCVGMALFTMVMGNAFAAVTVLTVGIGIPFVLQAGGGSLNPNVIGMLALTSGYCGTLMTPMAANFNIVPIAVLEQKNKYNVIKHQIPIAISMLIIQIFMMRFMS